MLGIQKPPKESWGAGSTTPAPGLSSGVREDLFSSFPFAGRRPQTRTRTIRASAPQARARPQGPPSAPPPVAAAAGALEVARGGSTGSGCSEGEHSNPFPLGLVPFSVEVNPGTSVPRYPLAPRPAASESQFRLQLWGFIRDLRWSPGMWGSRPPGPPPAAEPQPWWVAPSRPPWPPPPGTSGVLPPDPSGSAESGNSGPRDQIRELGARVPESPGWAGI